MDNRIKVELMFSLLENQKKVKIISEDNIEYIGYVVDYTPAGDSDDLLTYIGVQQDDCDFILDLSENEINSIEEI